MNDSTHLAGLAQGPAVQQSAEVYGAPTPNETAITYPLVVVIDGNQQTIDTSSLADEMFVSGILSTCKEAAEPAIFTLQHLLDWNDEERWAVLMLVKKLFPYYLARASIETQAQPNIFAIVLSLMIGPADVVRCERGRRAAIEAAALFHGDALEPSCTLIAQRLKELGVKGVLPQKILKEARNIAGEVDQGRRDPEAAARAFLAKLRQEARLAQGDRPLHYYRHDFFAWASPVEPWSKGRWRHLDDEELKAQLTAFLQEDGQVERVTDRFVRDVMTNLKGLAMLDAWDEEMPFFIASGTGNGRPVVTRPRFIVFQNGMIDLDEAIERLAEHSDALPKVYEVVPDYFSLNRLPFAYDPDAWCPLWEQTLDEVLPRTSVGDHRREVLQEFMGWTLVPGDLSFQQFLILVGGGRNGKSTVMDLWANLLGRDNVSHVPLSHLGGEFRLYEMAGKLANIAGDMTRLDRVEEGVLKQLTTGDPMQVNRKHRPPVTLRPTARLIFGTNTLPPFSDRTEGVWRRMIALPFTRQIPKDQVDPRRVERLKDELPGIFSWALAGAVRLYRQQGFTDCSVCERCVEEHRYDSDPFRQFVDERLVFGETLDVAAHLLYQDYVTFCQGNGRLPRCSSEVGKQVLRLPGVHTRRNGGGLRQWVYTGVTLDPSPSPYG